MIEEQRQQLASLYKQVKDETDEERFADLVRQFLKLIEEQGDGTNAMACISKSERTSKSQNEAA